MLKVQWGVPWAAFHMTQGPWSLSFVILSFPRASEPSPGCSDDIGKSQESHLGGFYRPVLEVAYNTTIHTPLARTLRKTDKRVPVVGSGEEGDRLGSQLVSLYHTGMLRICLSWPVCTQIAPHFFPIHSSHLTLFMPRSVERPLLKPSMR